MASFAWRLRGLLPFARLASMNNCSYSASVGVLFF